MKKDKMNILICFWNSIGIFIVAGFFLYGFMIGGSASLGYCDANAYYVGNHGEYTQVSEIIYHVSYVWEILFWIFIPLTPLGCFFDFAYSRKNGTKEKTVRVEQTPFVRSYLALRTFCLWQG